MKNFSIALLMTLAFNSTLQAAEFAARLQVTTNQDDNSTTISITDHDKKTAKAVSLGAGAGFFTGVIIADALQQESLPKGIFALAFATSLNIVGKNMVTESLGADYVKTAGISEAVTALLTWFAITAK